MDRRDFLIRSAALAIHPGSLEVQAQAQQNSTPADHPMAPPVQTLSEGEQRPPFRWEAAGLVFSFEFQGDQLRFRHVLPSGAAEPSGVPAPTETSGLETSVLVTGEEVADHHGAKLTGGSPGTRLHFVGVEESTTPAGRRLIITQEDRTLRLRVESVYQAVCDAPILRRSTRLTNLGTDPIGIEYVSSAMLNNFADPNTFQDDLKIHFAYNSWQAEAQWQAVRASEAGLVQNGNFTVSGVLFSTMGSWPCETYLPMAMVENTRLGLTWFWQVEHNGSWHCEVAQTAVRALYCYLGGPDAQHAQAWKSLSPGEVYETVPVAIGCVRGGFGQAVAELTQYRRAILRHRRSDTQACPVVFNDVVMLNGDQTTRNEPPLIDAAAEAGCDIYCMDAGWSARPGQGWWDAVGDWQPDPQRFPDGLKPLVDHIRGRGMAAGIWIEPEVAGVQSAVAKRPDAWFFMRHGRRVIDHTRYHLDFRNPEVIAYINGVFDRLIADYGFRYIKLDYNINALEGTESHAESFGQGLLGHNRAFLMWMDSLLDRYPTLTIETVASGSMRMEYSMLSRAQLQSISDQDDYRSYASITTGCSAALLPEQMGVWSQPLENATPEIASCNMVNAMLGRIHQSGFLTKLSQQSRFQVTDGIAVYKRSIRPHTPMLIPFYPLGMPDLTRPAQPAALGMRSAAQHFLAIWRRQGPEEVQVPGPFANFRLIYPSSLGITTRPTATGIAVRFPAADMACILAS